MRHAKPIVLFLALFFFTPAAHASWMQGEHYTLDQFYQAIKDVQRLNPGIVTITEFGKSVQGRPLLLIKIGRDDGVERAEALITGNVHADEWMGGRLALSVAERLASGDGKDEFITSLLDDMDFYIAPLMNPDGYLKADKHLDWGYTLARDNANHVDLNRNWPYPAEAVKNSSGRLLGGANFKWHSNYRGPYPLSEPENRALNDLVAAHRFFVAIDFHTTGGHFSYAWSYTGDPTPDKKIFDAMGIEFRKHQQMEKYEVHQSYQWYQIVGASKDWFYGTYGVRALTIEVGKPSRFNYKKIGLRILNPFYQANDIEVQPWIDNDRDAALYALEECFELTGGEPAKPDKTIEWVSDAKMRKESQLIVIPVTPP